jgi:Tfp pilus assembly protein PilO
MATITARERMLIGVAAAAVVAIVGWILVIEPLRARNRELGDLVPARALVLDKRRELIGRAPEVRRELDETAQQVAELKTRLLTAAAPPVAASELVKIVKDAAGQAGLEVRSERILTPATRGELLEIPLEITVAGGIRELVALLYQLEGARQLLALQDVKIRVLNVSQPKELLTTITVSGFILPTPKRS